ncbi:MAG: acyltransferase [Chloroflexota bacterium]
MYSKDRYRDLLKLALDQNYRFISFFDEPPAASKSIYLRHDVDASLTMALEMAKINQSLGIRATFFLLRGSQIYNLASEPTKKWARAIADAGQDLGFHCVVPTQVSTDGIAEFVRAEYEVARHDLPELQPVFSWHNTTDKILEWSLAHDVPGLVNAYHPRFWKSIPYKSDSLGRHTPEQFEVILRENQPTMQLLFHPEIWIGGGETLREISAHVWKAVIRERDYDPEGTNPAFVNYIPNRIPDAILNELERSLIYQDESDAMAKKNPPNELLLQQQALYQELRAKTRTDWDRDLPFSELVFDRWERAQALNFGSHASIYHNSYVYGDVRAGEHTWIGPFTLLDGSGGGITIGRYCNISAGVQIYTHHTVRWVLSGGKAEPEQARVEIGDCTYIGPQTVISKGVKIGDHCVIGAGSLVNSDIPPYTVAFGVPCRPQGRVVVQDDGQIELIYDS